MNILLIGGNGYLGSKVTNALSANGHVVIGTRMSGSDISKITDRNVTWIPASFEAAETALKFMDMDCIVNLACNYGKGVSGKTVIDANLVFPLGMLSLAVERGVKKYVTIGTSLPDTLNMYSYTKKKMSEFGRFYSEENGICFCNLLLEMFYGWDEPSDRFIPSVIRDMLCGRDVNTTLGTQKRDIISVDDVVKAILAVTERALSGYHDIPVGTGEAPAISEIIDFIWEETGQRSKLNKGAVPLRRNEPDCIADTEFLNLICDWKPVKWKTGLRNMIREIKDALNVTADIGP